MLSTPQTMMTTLMQDYMMRKEMNSLQQTILMTPISGSSSLLKPGQSTICRLVPMGQVQETIRYTLKRMTAISS